MALRHIFFAERAAGKIAIIKDIPPTNISEIDVVGGGTKGAGIAAACLFAEKHVTMIECAKDALQAGQSRVSDILTGSLKRDFITIDRHTEFAVALKRQHGLRDFGKG